MPTRLTAEQKAALALQEEKNVDEESEATGTTVQAEPIAEMSHEEWLNERVPFQAFYDGDKYKDDITVTVNGYNRVIKRGELVMIPRYVLHAIENAEAQKKSASRTSEEYEAILKKNQATNMM